MTDLIDLALGAQVASHKPHFVALTHACHDNIADSGQPRSVPGSEGPSYLFIEALGKPDPLEGGAA